MLFSSSIAMRTLEEQWAYYEALTQQLRGKGVRESERRRDRDTDRERDRETETERD